MRFIINLWGRLILPEIRQMYWLFISVHSYKEIICFCICLRETIDSDILVTSDTHDEIYLLKEKEIIWSKDLSYDYSKIIE